ncbi:hypothetical protein ACQBAU_11420 [Propionibacteriaceae bacterium Y2011]
MALYSRRPGHALGQVLGDLFMVVWAVGWFVVGRVLDGLIRALASPVRETAEQAEAMAEDFRQAGEQAGQVPGVGDGLSTPFEQAAGSLGELASAARDQVAAIEVTATVVGVICFAIPFLGLLAIWLPRRIAFVRAARAGQELLRTEAGVDLLALRAMSTVPLSSLAKVSTDPVQDWRDGDLYVISTLAGLEARRLGLPPPGARRRTAGSALPVSKDEPGPKDGPGPKDEPMPDDEPVPDDEPESAQR